MPLTVKHMVGDVEVFTLTDGVGGFEASQFPDTAPGHIAEVLKAAGKTAIDTNFNAHLLRGPHGTTLVDTGARDLFGPRAGKLLAALDEIGCKPAEIDRIFLTHMHGDHCAGAITATGEAVFPHAEMILSDVEHDFFSDRANFAGKGERAEGAHHLAMAVFAAYRDRLRPVAGAADLGGWMSVVPLYGHTAGHSGLKVSSTGAVFFIVADIVHSVDLQIADPEIAVIFDRDPAAARRARKTMLAELAATGAPCTGGHFLYPGIGRIEAAGEGFRYVPC